MNDKKRKNEYVKPEAEITEFVNEDVILTSNPFTDGTNNAENWWQEE